MSDMPAIEQQDPLRNGDFTAESNHSHCSRFGCTRPRTKEPNDPNAMALATVDADGLPDVRMVLLKGFDERGFVFYTNTDSQKGRELAATPKAALLFHWKSLRPAGPHARTGRARSPTPRPTPISPRRPRLAQIGAWASKQSRPLESRLAFEKAVALYTAKLRDRHRAAAAALVRLSHRAAVDRVLARPAVPAARPHRVPPRRARQRRGARRGSIREIAYRQMPQLDA